MYSRRILAKILLFILGLFLFACLEQQQVQVVEKIVIGAVSYERATDFMDRYRDFQNYLARETKTFVELEPTFNERRALEQIERRAWSIVFAPPGLAAIAIERDGYLPIFATNHSNVSRSLIVVREDSNLQELGDLSQKTIALGQRGSAAGYYLPLYDLFGLTLKEIRFAPIPRNILKWLEESSIDAGALSRAEFDFYKTEFNSEFRILHESRAIPAGLVLLNPDLAPELRTQIQTVMQQVSPELSEKVGYALDTEVPDYEQFIILVNKVRPLETKLNEKPVVLTNINDSN